MPRQSSAAASASTSAAPPSFSASFAQSTLPEARKGMAYVSPGALVAGSLPNSLPRRPDRELPGEQVMMKGFWIDRYAYPNEEGAIPLTSVTEPEAQTLCEKAGKRLCTELEWERACKGPLNHRYAWGEQYRADACQLGSVILPRPAGMKVGCHSDFDVYDLHGGILEWTMSRFRRGISAGQFVLKGGNGIDGALIGRCANAEIAAPTHRSLDVGFRCCAGPVNSAEVIIQAGGSEAVQPVEHPDIAQFQRLLHELPPDQQAAISDVAWTLERAYVWHPVNNEGLSLFVACSKLPAKRRCGLLVGRDTPAQPTGFGFADTGIVTSSLHMDSRTEDIWLLGLDAQGNFKRLVRYHAGEVTIGPKERRIPSPKKHGPKSHQH